MRVSATAKYVRISPRKVRLVTDLIVGRPVEEAAALLRFMPQAAARDVAKVLRSATANAENNFNLTADELHVESAVANEGPTLKRIRPRARARVSDLEAHEPYHGLGGRWRRRLMGHRCIRRISDRYQQAVAGEVVRRRDDYATLLQEDMKIEAWW